MRKFALLASAGTVLLFATFVRAQQFDFTLGASTLFSSKNTNASQSYVPPAEKAGIYSSFGADVLLKKHLGFNAEIAVRTKQGLYNGFQNFRPVFYDLNGLYSARLSKRTSFDLMAGVGGETLLFYSNVGVCNSSYSSCSTYLNSTHFMAHVGGGVRYYFWHRFFLRPEAHVYVIPNNFQFNSDYVARVGASIGYSLAPR